jgi:putative SOS response-associated peptidase YedK
MCGRYASFLPPEFLARLFGTVNPPPNLQPTWNLAPTDDAPVVRLDRETGARHLDVLKWGLIPYFTKDVKTARHPINARSDTVARSNMFKAAFAKRRCLVPAAAYYEWRDDPEGKTPFAVARLDGDPVVFGGIWEHWQSADGDELNTFATITTEANHQLSMIQPRMPVKGRLAGVAGRNRRRRPCPAAPSARGCLAAMARRQAGRQRQEQWAGTAEPTSRGA